MPDLNIYHGILGVGPQASPAAIKAAYGKSRIFWHPDRWRKANDEVKIKAINEIYLGLDDIRDKLLEPSSHKPDSAPLASMAKLKKTPSTNILPLMKIAFSFIGPIAFDIAYNLMCSFLFEAFFPQSQEQNLLSAIERMLDKKIRDLKIFHCEKDYIQTSNNLDDIVGTIQEINISGIKFEDNELFKKQLADLLIEYIQNGWDGFLRDSLNESTQDDLNQEIELAKIDIIALIDNVLKSLSTDKISVIKLSSLLIKELYPLVHHLLSTNLNGELHLISYEDTDKDVTPQAAELVTRLSFIILRFKYQLLSQDVVTEQITKLEERIRAYNRVVFGEVKRNSEAFSQLNLYNLAEVAPCALLFRLNSDIFDDASTQHASITTYIDRLESLKFTFHLALHRSYTLLEALYRINFEHKNAETILALHLKLPNELDRIFRSLHPMFYDLAQSYEANTGAQLPHRPYAIKSVYYNKCFLHSSSNGKEAHCTTTGKQEDESHQWIINRVKWSDSIFYIKNIKSGRYLSCEYKQTYHHTIVEIRPGTYKSKPNSFELTQNTSDTELSILSDKSYWQIALSSSSPQNNAIYFRPANAILCVPSKEKSVPFTDKKNIELTPKDRTSPVLLYIGCFFNQTWVAQKGYFERNDTACSTWELHAPSDDKSSIQLQ